MKKTNRVIAYYKKYGFRNGIKHSLKKVVKVEEREYKEFRGYTVKSKKEYSEQRNKVFAKMPKISIVVPLYKTLKYI